MWKRSQFVLLLVAAAFGIGLAHAQVTINSRTSLLIDPREPGPIQKAAHELASDMVNVFGQPVRWASEPSRASATTICIAFSHNVPSGVIRPSGWETLRLQTVANPWPGSPVRQAIVLTGSDVLGTIYAIYQFSQQFLGVDPFYWWTDNLPAHRALITIPDKFYERQGPPTFRYRGWFINDEDLLTGWKPGNREGTGISLEVWNRIFEALLRLKGNMIIPGTYIFPYEPEVRAAAERGLMITQHHDEPLGVNVYRWPEQQPYTFDLLEKAWKCAVSQYPKNLQIVWTVGLRGRYDRPFWLDMPDVPPTAEGRAALIQKAIETQIRIVKQEWPHPNPHFIMNTWMEGSRMMRSGVLKVPPGVTLVWADDGGGLIQDEGQIAKGEGVYYHTAVIGGNANNFTERVPVARIQRELGRAARAGATEYLLLNTADIRPVAMTTRAVMELAWDAQPWTSTGHDEALDYLHRWSREEFGAAAAPFLVQYYQDYFHAPARFGTKPDDIMGDTFYAILGRVLLWRILKGETGSPLEFPKYGNVKSYLENPPKLIRICEQADQRWQKAALLAKQAEALVPPGRREFFQAHVLTELDLHIHGNRMLIKFAQAATPGTVPSTQLRDVQTAISELGAVHQALIKADYGKWEGFYTRGDGFVNFPLTLALAHTCVRKLEGKEFSPADRLTLKRALVRLTANTSSVFISMKEYQDNQRVQFCEPSKSDLSGVFGIK